MDNWVKVMEGSFVQREMGCKGFQVYRGVQLLEPKKLGKDMPIIYHSMVFDMSLQEVVRVNNNAVWVYIM